MAIAKTRTALPVLLSLCLWTAASADPPAAPTTAPTTTPTTVPAAASTTGPTTAPTTGPSTRPSAEVKALIDRLSSDDWRERRRAEDRLVQIGEDAVPALRKAAAEAPGTEQRTRAESAAARIEQIAANGPTLITMHLKDVTPKAVVAEFVKQSGAPIKVWPEDMWDHNVGRGGLGGLFARKPKVTIDIDKKPFWLALADFCDKMNVRPEEMGYNQGITLMQGGGPTPLRNPQCLSGKFLVIATSAQRQRWVQFGPNVQRLSADSLGLQVYVDPRAKVISYSSDPEVTEAVDDKGKSLGTHKPPPFAFNQSGQRPFTFSLTVPLSYPDDGYTKLARLKGNFRVLLAAKSETLEIADLEKALNVPRTIAGRTVELKQIKVTEHELSYHLHVRRAGMPADQWQNMFNELEAVRITDADGHTFSGSGGGRFGGDECDTENNCSTTATIKKPLKLVWEMTTETREQSVPFEFKDLPLPTP